MSPDLTRALALVNAEIDAHVRMADYEGAALLREVGRRVLAHPAAWDLLGDLAWHRALHQFRAAAARVPGPVTWDLNDSIDRLLAQVLRGQRPDVVAAFSLSREEYHHRRRVVPALAVVHP